LLSQGRTGFATPTRLAGPTTRAQEWSLLLMNLRQYANPEGTLPADFDELVRESFGELIESASIP